jgi:hypothetical protein
MSPEKAFNVVIDAAVAHWAADTKRYETARSFRPHSMALSSCVPPRRRLCGGDCLVGERELCVGAARSEALTAASCAGTVSAADRCGVIGASWTALFLNSDYEH